MASQYEELTPQDLAVVTSGDVLIEGARPRIDDLKWPEHLSEDQRREVVLKVRLAFRSLKQKHPKKVMGQDNVILNVDAVTGGVVTQTISVANLSLMFADTIKRTRKAAPRTDRPKVIAIRLAPLSLDDFLKANNQNGFGLEEAINDPDSIFSELVGLES